MPVVFDGLTVDTEDTGSESVSPMPPDSDDLTCQVCGTGISYGGRGPKPKYCDEHKRSSTTRSSSPGRRSSSDVQTALAAMEAMYAGTAMLLQAISPAAASTFAANIERAQMQNRLAFESDRDLVRTINKGAGKGGKAMFFIAQVTLLGPAVRVAVTEANAKRPPKPPKPGQPSRPAQPASDTPQRPPMDPVDRTFAERQAQKQGVSV